MSRHFLRDYVFDPLKDGFGWPFTETSASRSGLANGPLTDMPRFTVVDEAWGGFAESPGILGPQELVNQTEGLVNGEEPDESESDVLDTGAVQTTPPYAYSDRVNEKHIRILELLPGNPADDIHCSLKIYSLDTCPEYEALSYCWGDGTDTTPINVEDGMFHVTINLCSALRHLRRKSKSRLLWIDEISIYQRDPDERTGQVNLMRYIYRKATRTVVWLGLTSQNSGLALLTCFKLAKEGETVTKAASVVQKQMLPISPSAQGIMVTEKERNAVIGLVSRTWFQRYGQIPFSASSSHTDRVWVVQEVGVARDVIVVCGWREVDWRTLALGIKYGMSINQLNISYLGITTTTDYLNFIAITTVNTRNTDRPPAEQLFDLLVQFRTRDATDARDKVFSLLGLVEGGHELGLAPNYHSNCTPAKVYTQTAAAIISGSGNLDIFGLCPPVPKSDLHSILPTWVADWSYTKGLAKPLTIDAMDRRRTSNCSGSTKALPEFFEANTILAISGHTVDFITDLGDVLHDMTDPEDGAFADGEMVANENSGTDEDGFRAAWKELKSGLNMGAYGINELFKVVSHLEVFLRWEKLARIDQKKDATPTPTGENHTSVYWQTLCTGCMPDGYAATEKQYQEWYSSLSTVRRLVQLRINRLPSLFRPLAFAGYVRATWEAYGKFGSLMKHTNFRRLARSKRGYLCLVPEASRVNDPIVLCAGGKVPLIARVQDGYWRLVGESYVHGLMNGESFDEDACEEMFFK